MELDTMKGLDEKYCNQTSSLNVMKRNTIAGHSVKDKEVTHRWLLEYPVDYSGWEN